MATVTGYTAARMKQIEDETIVSGLVDVNGNLILQPRDGSPINAGNVIGPQGPPGSGASTGTQVSINSSGFLVITGANAQTVLASADAAIKAAGDTATAAVPRASGIVIVDSATPVARPTGKIVLWLNNSANAVAGDWRLA